MAKDFFTALKDRRSYYGISKEQVISDQRIQEIVEEAVKYTPTSFNSQTSRAVVLLGNIMTNYGILQKIFCVRL